MWLDRFSNNSTPTGASTPSRAFSPAPPPRKSQLQTVSQRNGIGLAANRSTSSLGLTPTSSSVSLPIRHEAPENSLLRSEQKQTVDVPDPLLVLTSILNHANGKERPEKQHPGDNGALDALRDFDFAGQSLEDYAKQPVLGQVEQYEAGQSANNDQQREKYNSFHIAVSECDETLQSIESYLTNFKAELGQVSAEIENLQARSVRLNSQLDNRRKVEKLLGPAVEDLSISPAIVRAIADGPVDATFGKALTEIEARHLAIANREKDEIENKVVSDIKPLLEELKLRAIERIRDYLVAQIKALRSPNINAQIIQRQTLLRHKELYPFLSRNHTVLADEIGEAYANTMRWYYISNFTRYRAALDNLQLVIFDQADLLGADPTSVRRSALSASKGGQAQHDSFGLGKRADILRAKTASAIPSHVAEDSKATHYLEVPFRNFNLTLLDNATSEYSAATELFSTNSYHQVSKRLNRMFEPTFNLGHDLTRSLVENSTDCIGILICVRLNQYFARESQKRKVPILDSYINYTNILLWPRFQKIMDLHCESLRKVPTSLNRGAVAAFSLVAGADSSKASVAPHFITQRFGQFLHCILALGAEAGDDEPVSNSLLRLRTEYEALMVKLARGAGDTSKRSRFLYNNYSLVLTIIGDTQGKLAEEQKEHFSVQVRDLKPK